MSKTYIIAEAGVNHNGSLDLAEKLVDAAAAAGADAVKFQTFRAQDLLTVAAPKAAYQKQTTGERESQFQMIKALELDHAAHLRLREHCQKCGIAFLSTPFDLPSLAFLAGEMRLPRIKLASGEITNAPLLWQTARSGIPAILSTGMSTLGEVEDALSVLAFGYTQTHAAPNLAAFRRAFASPEGQAALREKVALLHCTTEYPAPFDSVNLRAMDTLRDAFGLAVGYSDHTPGIAVPVAAVARGATVIEKHLTLDKNLPGPDHRASLEPDEFAAMVAAIRQVEAALGAPGKYPADCEWGNREIARKSLVALAPLRQGELFTPNSLGVKRPGGGVSPLRYWDYLGRPASRDYRADEMIE
jgi:N-acetylneuraminate synthase